MKPKPSPTRSIVDVLDDPTIIKLLKAAVRKRSKRPAARTKVKRLS